MLKVALALYAEGSTDDDFLPLIIQRTAQVILARHEQHRMQVLPIETINLNDKQPTRAECILKAAILANRYHALVVHSDADHPNRDRALQERIQPGFDLIQQASFVCKNVLPIIPIQTVEAWMLVDHEMLREELRTRLSTQELDLPEKAKLVEIIAKPKQRLEEIVLRANRQLRPRQRLEVRSLYAPLGKKVRLERLNQLTAYQQFVQDLTVTLQNLNMIQL